MAIVIGFERNLMNPNATVFPFTDPVPRLIFALSGLSLLAYTMEIGARFGDHEMTEEEKEKAKAAAAAGVGAGVGTAGGASIGVLELAAQGAVTGFSAGLVIGLGAVAGALLGLAGYGAYRRIKNKQKT